MSIDYRKPNWLQDADEQAGIDQPPCPSPMKINTRTFSPEEIAWDLIEVLADIVADVECYCSDSPTGICPMHRAKDLLGSVDMMKPREK